MGRRGLKDARGKIGGLVGIGASSSGALSNPTVSEAEAGAAADGGTVHAETHFTLQPELEMASFPTHVLVANLGTKGALNKN